MKKYLENLAKALLGQSYSSLSENEQKVIDSIADQTSVATDINESFSEELTLGQRVADRVARFGGSWSFIFSFFFFILGWVVLNSFFLVQQDAFDPYPYILLNLGLSSLAAFQAPIIMMSQNRQAAKDKLEQDAKYELNLKMELEIMRLHDKIDHLLQQQQVNKGQTQ